MQNITTIELDYCHGRLVCPTAIRPKVLAREIMIGIWHST